MKLTEKIKSLSPKQKLAGKFACACAVASSVCVPGVAFADGGQGMLTQVVSLLAKGVIFLGGAMCLWGIIQLG